MENPLVTVIVPAYNAARYIEETLESIIQQTYQAIEIIVVDDGSSDNTGDIIKSYNSGVHYLYQENSGSCASPRNNGLSHAKGQFVTFFDADDIMIPDKIERQVKDLQLHPDATMSICNYRNFIGADKSNDHFASCPKLSDLFAKTSDGCIWLEPEACRSILIDENFGSACSPLFRTASVRLLGGFDETLKACEDFHLNYRMAQTGPVVVNRHIGFERRLHDLNMSGDQVRMLKNFIQSRLSLQQSESDPQLSKRLRNRVTKERRSLQACLIQNGSIREAVQLYTQTLPPKSVQELRHDLSQAAKIVLKSTVRANS